MADVPTTIKTWQMVTPWGKNKETGEVIQGKLAKTEIPVPPLKEGDVLVLPVHLDQAAGHPLHRGERDRLVVHQHPASPGGLNLPAQHNFRFIVAGQAVFFQPI